MPQAVTIFKNLSDELENPKNSFFVAKLDNPTLSCGTLRKIMKIKKALRRNANNFIILLKLVKLSFFSYFKQFYSSQFFNLLFQKLL